jgi:beta-xylosidase
MLHRLLNPLVLFAVMLLSACGEAQTLQSSTGSASPQATAETSVEAPTTAPTNAPVEAAAEVGATAAAATPTLGPDMYINPVLNQDFPDPDVLKVGDTYYAYATGNFDRKISVKIARSQDLITWEPRPDAMPDFPTWAEKDHGLVWAPEVTTAADGQSYLLYYTARVAKTTTQCIGVATSTTPEGPFQSPNPEPFICQRDQGGSIDASSFVDDDGTRYLLWKNDGNCCGGRTWIYIQEVSADGLTLQGEPTQLFHADQSWEGAVTEAPTLWKHEGTYYLFYSANDYSSLRYAVGYATADSPLGPYTKAKKPLVASSVKNGVVGPGGQDIVIDPDGDTWMLYHSWGPGYRSMSANELTWNDKTPVLNGPSGKTPAQLPQAN